VRVELDQLVEEAPREGAATGRAGHNATGLDHRRSVERAVPAPTSPHGRWRRRLVGIRERSLPQLFTGNERDVRAGSVAHEDPALEFRHAGATPGAVHTLNVSRAQMRGSRVRLPDVTRRVWVDAWQLQCCGDPIHVGRDVTLTVSPNVDVDYLGTVLGEERASTLTDYEDHHDVEAPVVELLGVVDTVEAVSCEFSLQGRALYPVAGTSVVEHRERGMDGSRRPRS
jgi:hypothetical protein